MQEKIFEPTAFEYKWSHLIGLTLEWVPKIFIGIISAVLLYFVGSWLIRLIKKMVFKAFERQNIDPSLRNFLGQLISWALNILLFIVIITQLGVQTSAFVAIIGAAGLAIGLSLQGSLSNFAGGVLILLLKPFKLGDFISSGDLVGTVAQINIFNTTLTTLQNQVIVIPNGNLSNSNITNFSQLPERRTWFDIGVSYDADLRKAKDIIMSVIEANEYAYKDPVPEVMVTNLGDSAVNLSVRVSTSTANFWTMQEQLIIDCKEALEKKGISIPFPQRDVHVYQKS